MVSPSVCFHAVDALPETPLSFASSGIPADNPLSKAEYDFSIHSDALRRSYASHYLEEHLNGFPHYDDEVVRKMIERVTVVDAETIRVKFRYSDLEIEQSVC